jgi:hypothetical protein
MTPRMNGIIETALKDLNKALRGHRERPFDEFIRQAARARC